MKLSTLQEWLTYIASIHTKSMDLGLERVKEVAGRLGLMKPRPIVIIIGGTNGKGSTVAALEAIYLAQGFQVGCFTTPYLYKHNEQVRINGNDANDELFIEAFEKVEGARGKTSLTQFEFNTLAALYIFQKHPLDVILLEVGLGGRLDATNIIDADLAIITSISIDHIEWLGNTVESIGREKAGIFRRDTPAICGDPGPPQTLLEYAKNIGCKLYRMGIDFRYSSNGTWIWETQQKKFQQLPINTLPTQNMATALMAIELLQAKLNVTEKVIRQSLKNLTLPGRMEIHSGTVIEILDVAHNQASVALLAQRLAEIPNNGKTFAVFSMLADKDIATSIKQMQNLIDYWFVGEILFDRRASLDQLKNVFNDQKISNVDFFSNLRSAYKAAKNYAKAGDRIIIFGSFHTLAEIK